MGNAGSPEDPRPPAAPAQTLLLLTFVAGIVDATSFLALGGVFAAMMTGNVIFFGFGLVDSIDAPVLGPFIGIAAFIAASGAAALVTVGGHGRIPRPGAATVVEIGLLSGAAILAAGATVRSEELAGYLTIAMLAFAMGWRGTIVRSLGSADVPTTVLNLTVIASPSAGGLGIAPSGELRTRGLALLVLLCGAVLGGLLLYEVDLWAPLALAALLSFAAGAEQVRLSRAASEYG